MGLYSTVFNQCKELGEEFLGELQTKDLECMLDSYWLSPTGCLYRIDESDAYDLVPEADPENRLLPYQWVRNSRNGRVSPYRKSGVLCFSAHHQGEYLECLTHFKTGMLTGVLCRGPLFSCQRVDG